MEIISEQQKEEKIGTPFKNTEEVWFWFIQAQQARNEGARIQAGLSLTERPCEPADILKILDRLYRQRMLTRDHLLVLRHYGRRQLKPDFYRIKEARAATIWKEAINRLEPVFLRKGLIAQKKLTTPHPNKYWRSGAMVHNGFQERPE